MAIWLKIKSWLLGIAALIVGIAAAWFLGRRKGSAEATQQADLQQQAQQAENNVAAAQAAAEHAEVRHDVETQTAALPDAPAQRVADADPSTAAGQLRDNGWTR